MVINSYVIGSEEASQPFISNHNNIYLHFDIKKYDKIDPETNIIPENLYEYSEIVMTKEEYYEYLQYQISANKENNDKQAAALTSYILNDEISIDFLVNQLHAGNITFNDIPANIYNEVQQAYADKVYHIEYPAIGLNL